ncbi:hypothetical protein OYT88_11780 [Sporolactobacillus sp. CQH2019]|uniref:hypothetical protein n=1 Tax=Sporolactobacillus sp. CQH2019 TaxID=3023512 RepID=UPI002368BD03|nr:hypothetical protein [Sporolactobacillus sp. CQH2019]MDD9149233.1 hypothetical protein [Sporolactobacillus sp. CQH2019]
MKVEKAAKLFKLCIKAERQFENEHRHSLVRRSIRRQHQLFCFIAKETSDEYHRGSFKVGKLERMTYEILKLNLTGRLSIDFDDVRKRVNLSHRRKKAAANDSSL